MEIGRDEPAGNDGNLRGAIRLEDPTQSLQASCMAEVVVSRRMHRRFMAIHAVRQTFGARLLRGMRARLEAQLGRRLSAVGSVGHLPELDATTATPDDFWRDYGGPHRPVVLRGFARHWPAVRDWSPEALADRCGDTVVPVRVDGTSVTDYTYARRPLRELVDSMLTGGTLTATGIEDVLHAHPELLDELNITAAERWIAPRGRRGFVERMLPQVFTAELFLGNARSRTSLHCAFGNNLFVMLSGRKTWTQIDPRHTALVGPRIQRSAHFMATDVPYRASPEEQGAAGYPLFHHAPRTEVVLEPGDAIFSPQWWWHAVENDGPTIGLACRAMAPLRHGQPLMSLLALGSRAGLESFLEARRRGRTSDRKVRYAAEGWTD